jgi:hypothetical protein
MRSIRKIYDEFNALGIVSTGKEFGLVLGKSPSYLSSSVARSRRPSTEVLLGLILKIEEIIEATQEEMIRCEDKNQAKEYRDGISSLTQLENESWSEIWSRVGCSN